jgi:hypothetical protein
MGRRFARRHALEFMEQQGASAVTAAQATQIPAEAKRWVRSKSRRKAR